MGNPIRRELSFSTPFLKVEYLENVRDLEIGDDTILVNLSAEKPKIEGDNLDFFESSVYRDVVVGDIHKAICIKSEENIFDFKAFKYGELLKEKWSHVYDIFPFESLKDVDLWRSPKERIGNVEYNLWYAPAGTHCGIHNEHDFVEIHTQVYGIGYMQKFKTNEYGSLYENICMAPGNSHKKFCNDKLEYPWHQYLSETDCIWLVLESY